MLAIWFGYYNDVALSSVHSWNIQKAKDESWYLTFLIVTIEAQSSSAIYVQSMATCKSTVKSIFSSNQLSNIKCYKTNCACEKLKWKLSSIIILLLHFLRYFRFTYQKANTNLSQDLYRYNVWPLTKLSLILTQLLCAIFNKSKNLLSTICPLLLKIQATVTRASISSQFVKHHQFRKFHTDLA